MHAQRLVPLGSIFSALNQHLHNHQPIVIGKSSACDRCPVRVRHPAQTHMCTQCSKVHRSIKSLLHEQAWYMRLSTLQAKRLYRRSLHVHILHYRKLCFHAPRVHLSAIHCFSLGRHTLSCLTRRVGRRVSMPSDVNVAFEVGYPNSTDTVERWSVNCSLCGGGGENRKRFEKERASDVAPS